MPPSSRLPTRGGNAQFDRPAEHRAILEEQWRRQVATIVELSYSALDALPREPDDDGSHAHTSRLNTGLLAAARQHLKEIEAALARVDDGRYGLCGDCGGQIAPERLEILPAARYCVPCQVRRAAR